MQHMVISHLSCRHLDRKTQHLSSQSVTTTVKPNSWKDNRRCVCVCTIRIILNQYGAQLRVNVEAQEKIGSTWNESSNDASMFQGMGNLRCSEQVARKQGAEPRRMEAIRSEAIAIRLEAILIRMEAIAIRSEAITIRLEAIPIRLEAIAIRLEAIVFGSEAIAIRSEALAVRLEATTIRLEAIAIRLEALRY